MNTSIQIEQKSRSSNSLLVCLIYSTFDNQIKGNTVVISMHNIIVKYHAVFSYISSPVLPPPLPTPGFKPGSHLCLFLLHRSLHPVM